MVCEAVPTIACDFSSMPDRLQHPCWGKICVPLASLAFSPRSSVEYLWPLAIAYCLPNWSSFMRLTCCTGGFENKRIRLYPEPRNA